MSPSRWAAGIGTGTQTSTFVAWQAGAFLSANTQTDNNFTTSGATFQLTGVMLNAGAFCLPFEKKLIQHELEECQRYFEKSYDAGAAVGTASNTLGPTGLITTAVLSVFATISLQHFEIRRLGDKLTQCHAENVTLEDSNRALLATIQNQNEAIASLEAQTKAKKAEAARAVTVAKAHAARYSLAAKSIEGQTEQGDECEGLKKLVNDFFDRRRQ